MIADQRQVIILDEADSMTGDAQAALRRTMETHSKVTRFCLVCNYVSRIIEPLASRCAKFRFKPLSGEVMRGRLQHVCRSEGIAGPRVEAVLDSIMALSGGDLRRAITYLQSTFRFYGSELDTHHIVQVAGLIPDATVGAFFETLRSNNFARLEASVRDLLLDGFSAQQLLEQVFGRLLREPSLSDVHKGQILLKIGTADKNLNDGCDEFIQLMSVASLMMNVFCQRK
jgi:replication factor C subunit 2/4